MGAGTVTLSVGGQMLGAGTAGGRLEVSWRGFSAATSRPGSRPRCVTKGAALTAGLAMLGGGAVATERHLVGRSSLDQAGATAVAPAPREVARQVVMNARPPHR